MPGVESEHSKEVLEQQPLIIMEDIVAQLKPWAEKNGFSLPRPTLIKQLRENNRRFLQDIFGMVISLSEEELSSGLTSLIDEVIASQNLTPIFIDNVYTQGYPLAADLRLDIGRAVDESGRPIGYQPRPGFSSIEEQCRRLSEKLSLEGKSDQAVLIDDAVVVGGTPKFAIKKLAEHGIKVRGLCVGVASEEATNRFQKQGVQVYSHRTFSQFSDIICEGDLLPGVSGLTVYEAEQEKDIEPAAVLCGSYLSPYLSKGVLEAVIPITKDRSMDAFIFFSLQSILLFEAIEKRSEKPVLLEDLPMVPTAMPGLANPKKRLVDALWKNLEDFVGFQEYIDSQRSSNEGVL